VLRDREVLARDGFVLVIVTLDSETGELLAEPEIISRGFVYLPEAEELFAEARHRIRQVLQESDGQTSMRKRTEKVENALKIIFQQETKRRPMIFVHLNAV